MTATPFSCNQSDDDGVVLVVVVVVPVIGHQTGQA